ncbi:rhomboid family intramembrane serine protease, partial [Gammaproteobacteria bacterium]|nr:rhomboid family intramembrane serine protease [Gammaproteobacteria bacterium]
PRYLPCLVWSPITAPLLHAHFTHLLFNSAPLFFLLCILFSLGTIQSICILLSLALYSGLMTWLLARKAIHIGASSVISGLMSFFAYRTYLNPSITGIVVVITLIYYFGSILLSFVPTDEKVSSEGHLFGLISGCIVAKFGCIPFIITFSQYLIKYI